MSDSGVLAVAIVGVALEFPGANDPAGFHDLVASGGRMFRPGQGAAGLPPVPAALIGGPPDAEHALAERTSARALDEVGQHSAGLRVGKLIARNPGCSLRAVAAACETLARDEYDLVLAGGVSLGIDQDWLEFHRRNQTKIPDEVRPYDARPTGSLPGEGCGVLAIMPPARARELGLEVYAEIPAWYASQPAETTDPADAIRDLYHRAGLSPGLVHYVEGHGAANAAGDQAELSLLLEVFSAAARPRSCALGAISACIGDTRAAAGAAGLIKSVLAMTSGVIPPMAACQQPHHLLEKETTPFWLPGRAAPWPGDGPRVAAVSAMRAEGPVHVVVRREPERHAGRRRRAAPARADGEDNPAGIVAQEEEDAGAEPADLVPRPRNPAEPPQLPVQRPPSTSAHPAMAHRWGYGPSDGPSLGSARRGPAPTGAPAAAATGAGAGRAVVVPKPPVVVALHGTDRADLASALDTIAIMASRLSSTDLHEFARQLAADEASAIGPLRAAILAEDPPQLAARAQRAADLARAAALEVTRAEPGLFLSENATGRVALLLSGLAEGAVQHSAAFVACRAALAWLNHAKVTPSAVIGYGIGEIVALAWADCLTMADAAFLIARRAEVLRAAPRDIAFARLEATEEITRELIEGTRLVVTSTEGAHQRLIAGPVPAIREMMDRAGTRHLRSVHIGTAATELAPAMRDAAAAVRFRPPRRRVISATWGRALTPEDDLAGLVGAHLTTPTRLADALAASPADLLIAPAELTGAAPGPVVETPDPRVPASVATARAALFAAGAISQLRG